MARGAVVGLVGEGLGFPAAIISAALLARHLGPVGFGVFGVAAASAALAAWTLASVFSRAALVLLPAARDPLPAASELLHRAIACGIAGWAMFAVASFVAAEVSGRGMIGPAGAVAGAEILLLVVSRLYRGVHTATGAFEVPGLGAGLFNAIRLAGVVAVVSLGGGPVAALAALSLARICEIAWFRHRLPLRPRRAAGGLPPGALRRLAGFTLVQSVCLQVFYRVDILLLGVLGASGSALGWYAAAQQVAVVPALVAGVLAPMATVALAGAKAGPNRTTLDRRTDLVADAGLAVFIASAGAAAPLAPLVFGAAFTPAAPLFAWLALGGAGAWLAALGSGRAAAMGEVARPALITATMLGAATLGHIMAIPRFGALGAAAVTATCSLVAGLAIHLTAPGRSSRRVAATALALLIGAGLAVASGRLITAAIALAGLS